MEENVPLIKPDMYDACRQLYCLCDFSATLHFQSDKSLRILEKAIEREIPSAEGIYVRAFWRSALKLVQCQIGEGEKE